MCTEMKPSSLGAIISSSQSSVASTSRPHDQGDLPSPQLIRPCGACKTLRRRCVPRCVLAPYFPPDQPFKFLVVHRVFGASNISKFLQELPESQQADAVESFVYEAVARIKDPVHGCAGEVCQLQKLVEQLQIQLATVEAQLLNTTSYQKQRFSCDYNSLIRKEMEAEAQQSMLLQQPLLLNEGLTLGTPSNFQTYECFSSDSSIFFPSNAAD